MTLYEEIRGMVATELAVDREAVVSEAHLQDDLGADSLALVNLAEAVSQRYGISLQGDDFVDLANFGELAKLVESRLASKS